MTDKKWAPCERKTGFCRAMNDRLNEDNARAKGLSALVLMHLPTGRTRTAGVSYKTSAKDKGLMLNVCPWCGKSILWIDNATEDDWKDR